MKSTESGNCGPDHAQSPEYGTRGTGGHTDSRMGENVDWMAQGVQNGGKRGADCTWGLGMEENTDRIAHGVQNWEFTEWMT